MTTIPDEMIPVDDALQIILESVTPSLSETIVIADADGRVLNSDIIADMNIPPHDNSAMDGYAVQYSTLSKASPESPVDLPVISELQAGDNASELTLDPGSAIRIMTGAPIPAGADAVIPVEDTEEIGGNVRIYRSLEKHENVRFSGEDLMQGSVALRKGTVLRSAHIGLLASLNMKEVQVSVRPHVAIISTGNEVMEVGAPLGPGQIRNSNAYTLSAEVHRYGAIPHYIGIARDDPEDTRKKFLQAMEHDIIITTGGVSMGRYDLVKSIMKELGVDIRISTIRMKPGKPMAFGTKGNRLFFGLPGNPVSTMVSFLQFVRPAILRFMGANALKKPVVTAVIDEEIRKKVGRRHFIRGHFHVENGTLHVTSTGEQGSGILRSMGAANCLIILDEETGFVERGSPVRIQLIRHEEVE